MSQRFVDLTSQVEEIVTSKLTIIDLAGSEKASNDRLGIPFRLVIFDSEIINQVHRKDPTSIRVSSLLVIALTFSRTEKKLDNMCPIVIPNSLESSKIH